MAAVGCLPNAKVVVWMQTILYFAAAVIGLFITIPMGVLLVSDGIRSAIHSDVIKFGMAELCCNF